MWTNYKQEIKNTVEPGQPNLIRRCGPFNSRHGCHKAEFTIKGDLTSVLSHKDSNTKTMVNIERGVQQKSPEIHKKNTSQTAALVQVGWEPFLVARENHALPNGSLSTTGRTRIIWSYRGLKQKVEEEVRMSFMHRLLRRGLECMGSTRRHPGGEGGGKDYQRTPETPENPLPRSMSWERGRMWEDLSPKN